MIKVKVIEDFTLKKFNELKNIERANFNKKEDGYLYVNDTFECTEKMAEYLTGKNALNRAFIEIIEVIPDKKSKEKETKEVEEKPVKKTTRKTTRKSVAKKK